jgi:hypothetical protein
METLLNPSIKARLNIISKSPPHAILIVGGSVESNYLLSIELASEILEIETEDFDSYPYKKVISSKDNKAISIEEIADLQKFLTLKIASGKVTNRVAIINGANLMSLPAQNALLKTLEEPPHKTVLILTTDNEESLISTIISRSTILRNISPTSDQLKSYFKEYNEHEFNRAFAISSNDVVLLKSLLEDKQHPLYLASDLTKKLLKGDKYERLVLVDELSKDREMVDRVLFILERMASTALLTTTKGSDKWREILNNSLEAKSALKKNAQTKLVLINLMLSI